MDEQQVLLYLSEFHRSEDPFSCNDLEESEVRSREIRPHSKKRKKLEFLRGCEHTTVSKLGLEELGRFGARPILFIYFFLLLLIRKNRVLSSFPNSGARVARTS